MTTRNRIALGLTVSVLGLLPLGLLGGSSGQEMAPEERRERCQNNLNRLVELERELTVIQGKTQEAADRASKIGTALTAVITIRSSGSADELPGPLTGHAGVDSSISETWNRCLSAEMLIVGPSLAEAKQACAGALEAGLRRARNDAKADEQRLNARKSELDSQARNCRTNLMALRCDTLGGAVDVDGTWNLTQANYTGWLTLHQTGAALTGTLAWSNHGEMGSVMNGTFANGTIRFQIAYASGDRGQYEGTVDPSGRSMKGTTSGTLGTASWSATRANQPER